MGPVGQLTNDHIPESKALVAGCAVREDPRVPSGALVTARTLHALHTDTLACGLVTLWCLNAPGITVTGSAFHIGVSPEELLALAAGSASKARHTLALPCKLIAGWPKGVCSIAVTGPTASPASQLPGVGRTPVTVLPDHIGKTRALTSGFVTMAVRAITMLLHGAQVIADTLSTVLSKSITVVPMLAELAMVPFRVVQALEASSGLLVTGFWIRSVNVVVTLTRLT